MEHWKPVVGWEAVYEVSNHGSVRRASAGPATKIGRRLKPYPDTMGYPTVRLCNLKRIRQYTVHTLVAAAFIGPRPEGLDVNHRDGIKSNNRDSNLEYCTCGENIRHAFASGLVKTRCRGEKHHKAKLKESDVRDIRANNGISAAEWGRVLGVSRNTIHRVRSGQNWRHITCSSKA